MRQHDLSFANFILRFGIDEVLLNHAEEIVLPAFLNDDNVRRYGETEYRIYNAKLRTLPSTDSKLVLAITGHFVKDTKLRRQQIFRQGQGLVANSAEIESAPSSFFVLILNNHRLLYFAETASAPTLDAFKATVEHFLRAEWALYLRRQITRENITRRGPSRLTLADMRKRVPTPVLSVIRVAGSEAITESPRTLP